MTLLEFLQKKMLTHHRNRYKFPYMEKHTIFLFFLRLKLSFVVENISFSFIRLFLNFSFPLIYNRDCFSFKQFCVKEKSKEKCEKMEILRKPKGADC